MLSRSIVSDSLRPQAPVSMRILQARILEWVAICFSRGFSQPKDWTQVSRIAGGFFTVWATMESQVLHLYIRKLMWPLPLIISVTLSKLPNPSSFYLLFQRKGAIRLICKIWKSSELSIVILSKPWFHQIQKFGRSRFTSAYLLVNPGSFNFSICNYHVISKRTSN